MIDKVFDTKCRQCRRSGERLMDCFCLLCRECFAARGRAVLGLSADSQLSQPAECETCSKPTAFQSVDLADKSLEQKLDVIANRFVASMYEKVRSSLLLERLEEVAAFSRRAKESQEELEVEKKKLAFSKRLLEDLVEKFGARLEDLEPSLYFEDKFGLLLQLFGNARFKSSVLPKAASGFEKTPEARKVIGLEETPVVNETKRKVQTERQLGFAEEPRRNPLCVGQSALKVTSFSAFKKADEEMEKHFEEIQLIYDGRQKEIENEKEKESEKGQKIYKDHEKENKSRNEVEVEENIASAKKISIKPKLNTDSRLFRQSSANINKPGELLSNNPFVYEKCRDARDSLIFSTNKPKVANHEQLSQLREISATKIFGALNNGNCDQKNFFTEPRPFLTNSNADSFGVESGEKFWEKRVQKTDQDSVAKKLWPREN